jgi:hypothetical protein
VRIFIQLSGIGAILVLALLLSSSPAQAGVIYDNGSPNLSSTYFSDPDSGFQEWDNFQLTTDTTITDVHWWGAYADGNVNVAAAPDDFTIQIWTDSGASSPDALLIELALGTVTRISTGDQILGGLDVYQYEVYVDAVTLDANTEYWLTIVNDSVTNGGGGWTWASSADTGSHWCVGEVCATGLEVGRELAFNLTGPTVPEPTAALCFAIGLAVLGATTRPPGA